MFLAAVASCAPTPRPLAGPIERQAADGEPPLSVSPPVDAWTDADTAAAPPEERPLSAALVPRTWLDLDAALGAALTDVGWTVLRSRDRSPTTRDYDLVSVRDEPGVFTAELPPAWRPLRRPRDDSPRSVLDVAPVAAMRLSVRLTHFGDQRTEAAVLAAVRAAKPGPPPPAPRTPR